MKYSRFSVEHASSSLAAGRQVLAMFFFCQCVIARLTACEDRTHISHAMITHALSYEISHALDITRP